jgi:hypothetical protein
MQGRMERTGIEEKNETVTLSVSLQKSESFDTLILCLG